jgi:hypothetical protein
VFDIGDVPDKFYVILKGEATIRVPFHQVHEAEKKLPGEDDKEAGQKSATIMTDVRTLKTG